MDKLKLICRTIVELVKQAWLLPQTIALAVEQRRLQLARPGEMSEAQLFTGPVATIPPMIIRMDSIGGTAVSTLLIRPAWD